MACFPISKINKAYSFVIYGSQCKGVVISSSSDNDRSWDIIFSCKMQQENEVPTRNIVEIFSCLYSSYKIKCTCFKTIFGPLLPTKSQTKLNLPNTQMEKLKLFLCKHYCFDPATVIFSNPPSQILKLVYFKHLG